MAVIDIGAAATDRAGLQGGTRTHITIDNPANLTGKIISVELWSAGVADMTDVRVGTFYGTAPDFTCRDYAVIGTVTRGSKQVFGGLDINVVVGDYIGIYNNVGQLEIDPAGGAGVYWKAGDQTEAGEQEYALAAANVNSIYGEGYQPGSGSMAIGTALIF